MNKMINTQCREREGGNALVIVLIISMILGGLATSFLLEGVREAHATGVNQIEMSLLEDAENVLHYNYILLSADELAPVKDTATYKVVDGMYVGDESDFNVEGTASVRFSLSYQYLKDDVSILFADRGNPIEAFDQILVFAKAKKASAERQVVASYTFQLSEKFGGAIISDALASGTTGATGKDQAKTGDIILSGNGRDGQHYVFGDFKANGAVRYYNDDTETALLDEISGPTYLGAFSGSIAQSLGGTSQEIPDFTSLTGDDQLFDFDRFKAAAAAGAGLVFTSLADFAVAMNAANAAGKALEGIIVLDLDSGAEGNNPKINKTPPTKITDHQIAGGINIKGTLLFNFNSGTPDDYKVFIKVPLLLNAADLSGLDPAVESTYTTGYPPAYDPATTPPWGVDITPTYSNFTITSDLPALMFNTGIVDIHDTTNISGVIYGPSFIEIENKDGMIQYFNGAIIGGAGVLLEGHATSGFTAIRYDANTITNLETKDNKGKELTRTGYAIIR